MNDAKEFKFTIAKAHVTELAQVREIYNWYVKNSMVSLDEDSLNEAQVLENYETVLSKNLPFLVAKVDDQVIGFCYANHYRRRSAYRYTVENSIYVQKDFLRRGVATSLMSELMRQCAEVGYKQMVAVVVVAENENSMKFHQYFGFREVGRHKDIALKFGKWVDTIIFQKELKI